MLIELQSPAPEVRYTLAGLYLGASVPDRVALQALALCVSWPSPPWEAAAQLEVERASQEDRDARQFLQVARDDERVQARQDLLRARQALQAAQEAQADGRFALRDVTADATLAMSRLAGAGIAPATWSQAGSQLLAAWVEELLPAPADLVADTVTFTLPPSAPVSGGGSGSPTSTPGTP